MAGDTRVLFEPGKRTMVTKMTDLEEADPS
jgi:hypothetical protein